MTSESVRRIVGLWGVLVAVGLAVDVTLVGRGVEVPAGGTAKLHF